jgi:phosphoglycolate phosphatase-like HAD superfamily hydrolase
MNNTLSTMIPFDPTKYDGYIFDCAGTLADTIPLHYRTWNETLTKKLGPNHAFTEDLFYRPQGFEKQLNGGCARANSLLDRQSL